jgi:hypothetical protein
MYPEVRAFSLNDLAFWKCGIHFGNFIKELAFPSLLAVSHVLFPNGQKSTALRILQ